MTTSTCPELVFDKLTRIEEVANIQIRQARMNELGDAFIALPGGFGTLYETLRSAHRTDRSPHQTDWLSMCGGYYDLFLSMLDHAIDEGFIYP